MLHHVKCNLCDADDYRVLWPAGRAQRHQIVQCRRCGLMYANPQERVDCDQFQAPDWPTVFDTQLHRQYFQKQQVQLPDNERALRVLNELFPQRGQLLEIGTFVGIFANRMRADGWEVTGLEPDRATAHHARTVYGLKIIEGLLETVEWPAAAYNAVVMLHVIEHMPDPGADLDVIRRLIKPGGVLVVETPRYDSLAFKLLGRRERSLSNCDGHIFFFTVPTLTQLLARHGFEVFRVDLVGRTLTLDRFLYNVGVVSRHPLVKKTMARLGSLLRAEKIHFHVNVRDMQRVYCRAKEPSQNRTKP